MICRIRAGSLTTDSLSAIGLRLATSASVTRLVTVQPWNRKSPVSSSMMPTNRSAMSFSLLGGLRNIAPHRMSPGLRLPSRSCTRHARGDAVGLGGPEEEEPVPVV